MYALNQLPAIDLSKSATNCCALIDPIEWSGLRLTFDNKLFAVAKTHSLFHIPLDMGSVMKKAQEKIESASAEPDKFLVLSYEQSPWQAEHYFAVSAYVPGLKMKRLSGVFMTRVFEGPFKYAPQWQAELIKYVKAKGKKPLKTYFFYTTCPKCSKVYGKNYVIGFEQVA